MLFFSSFYDILLLVLLKDHFWGLFCLIKNEYINFELGRKSNYASTSVQPNAKIYSQRERETKKQIIFHYGKV